MKYHPRKGIQTNAKVYGDMFWTFVIIISMCCLAGTCNGQISLQMRTGWAFKTKEPIIAPAIHFAAHGFALTPEMIIGIKDDSPVNFGLKISYEYVLRDELSIEAGYGRSFSMISMDKYDASLNGWGNLWFSGLHYRLFFIEGNYLPIHNKLDNWIVSFGIRETIGRLQ